MSLVVRPIRFTDDLAAMRDFLVLLGLHPRIESRHGGWLDLAGGAGLVALHDAATSDEGGMAGETRLSFEVADADAAAVGLVAAGFADVAVYDEAYGRALSVTDPLGRTVVADEQHGDLYGYLRHPVGATDGAPGVVPVRFTDDAPGYHAFLAAWGLTGAPEPGGYATYAADGHGWVGVHHGYDDLPVVGDGAAVHLTLAVVDVDVVQTRVEAAGLVVVRHDEEFGSFLDLTDPDGQSVQVHGLP